MENTWVGFGEDFKQLFSEYEGDGTLCLQNHEAYLH